MDVQLLRWFLCFAGARPFVCHVCNHGFTTSSSLTKHKRIHSGEKPYECEVCKMKFSRSGILARHRRTHTGEKPYLCQFCNKSFSQSNDLTSHLRIHTGEKPYVCDTCGQVIYQFILFQRILWVVVQMSPVLFWVYAIHNFKTNCVKISSSGFTQLETLNIK